MKRRRIIGLCVVVGFMVAVVYAGVSYSLNTHGLADSAAARFLAKTWYLWPTAILLFDNAGMSSDLLLLVLLVSTTLNGLIYGFVAWCCCEVWDLLTGPKDDGWWPSSR